jgi:hypothetical protein
MIKFKDYKYLKILIKVPINFEYHFLFYYLTIPLNNCIIIKD